MGFNDDAQSNNFNLQEVYENKRVEHQRNMQDKEDEMRQVWLVTSGSFLSILSDFRCASQGEGKRAEGSRRTAPWKVRISPKASHGRQASIGRAPTGSGRRDECIHPKEEHCRNATQSKQERPPKEGTQLNNSHCRSRWNLTKQHRRQNKKKITKINSYPFLLDWQ